MPSNNTFGADSILNMSPDRPCANATETPVRHTHTHTQREREREPYVHVSHRCARPVPHHIPTTNRNMNTCFLSHSYWIPAKNMNAEKNTDSVNKCKNNTGTSPIKYGLRFASYAGTGMSRASSSNITASTETLLYCSRDGVGVGSSFGFCSRK
jgi:hypothetical protein